jgi:hypothetical protein
MIIVFCTDTFFEWGRVFLESFRIHNGENIRIHINGAFLTQRQIAIFRGMYKNLTITNKIYEPEDVIKRFNVTMRDFEKCKQNIGLGIKDSCRWWMDFIAVEERITRLLSTIKNNIKNRSSGWWLQLDIDMMFRKPITELIDLIKSNDIIARFRPDRNFMIEEDYNVHVVPQHLRICAGMLGFNGEHTVKFIEDWIDEIFKIMGSGVHGRKGQGLPWGQYTLFNAYMKNIDKYKWGEVNKEWLTTECNNSDPIWCGHRKGRFIIYNNKGKIIRKIGIGTRQKFRERIFLPELTKMRRKHNG